MMARFLHGTSNLIRVIVQMDSFKSDKAIWNCNLSSGLSSDGINMWDLPWLWIVGRFCQCAWHFYLQNLFSYVISRFRLIGIFLTLMRMISIQMCGLTVCISFFFAFDYLKLVCLLTLFVWNLVFAEYSQDKHIQRDDEYYAGDNDNDHDMEEAS